MATENEEVSKKTAGFTWLGSKNINTRFIYIFYLIHAWQSYFICFD